MSHGSGGNERRSRARRRALQAVYQWQIKAETETAEQLIEQFLAHQDFSSVDSEYFRALVEGVVSDRGERDEKLEPFLDRPMSQLDQIEKAILRLGSFELLESDGVPTKVVIDEAIELAHAFGAEEGHSFINAVLDKAARTWRPNDFEKQ